MDQNPDLQSDELQGDDARYPGITTTAEEELQLDLGEYEELRSQPQIYDSAYMDDSGASIEPQHTNPFQNYEVAPELDEVRDYESQEDYEEEHIADLQENDEEGLEIGPPNDGLQAFDDLDFRQPTPQQFHPVPQGQQLHAAQQQQGAQQQMQQQGGQPQQGGQQMGTQQQAQQQQQAQLQAQQQMQQQQQTEGQSTIRNIERAVNGEYHDIRFYTKLAELAPERYKQSVLRVRQDEIGHFYTFSHLYHFLTGRFATLDDGPLPRNFRSGVREAMKDEQEASKFYSQIARQARNPLVRYYFSAAAADEARHYQLFNQINQQLGQQQ